MPHFDNDFFTEILCFHYYCLFIQLLLCFGEFCIVKSMSYRILFLLEGWHRAAILFCKLCKCVTPLNVHSIGNFCPVMLSLFFSNHTVLYVIK